MLNILQIIAAAATILTGLFALLRPNGITGFTGIQPVGGRGVTEVRAIFGALLIALGVYPLVAGSPVAYAMLGVGYLAIGAVRLVSIFIDKSSEKSNWISLAVEIVLGVVLVL
jgi:hypothetical protein